MAAVQLDASTRQLIVDTIRHVVPFIAVAGLSGTHSGLCANVPATILQSIAGFSSAAVQGLCKPGLEILRAILDYHLNDFRNQPNSIVRTGGAKGAHAREAAGKKCAETTTIETKQFVNTKE